MLSKTLVYVNLASMIKRIMKLNRFAHLKDYAFAQGVKLILVATQDVIGIVKQFG